MVNTYKYQQSNGTIRNLNIVFLRVIKTPYWHLEPSQICEDLPVDALTWTFKEYLTIDENGLCVINPECSIIIENNQYGFNYDPSCFEVLHTSVQKIKK